MNERKKEKEYRRGTKKKVGKMRGMNQMQWAAVRVKWSKKKWLRRALLILIERPSDI